MHIIASLADVLIQGQGRDGSLRTELPTTACYVTSVCRDSSLEAGTGECKDGGRGGDAISCVLRRAALSCPGGMSPLLGRVPQSCWRVRAAFVDLCGIAMREGGLGAASLGGKDSLWIGGRM